MNINYKNILRSLFILIISLLMSTLIINILDYFDILNSNLIKYFKMFLIIISFIIGGITIGKNSLNNGYLHGLRLSLCTITIFIILSLIMGEFKPIKVIYYIIITICITLGSMIGINYKK